MKNIIASLAAVALIASPVFASASVDLTLLGANPDTVRQGTSYTEPGFSAFSTNDGDITSLVSFSGIDTSRSGTFTRSYSVTDSFGDIAEAARTVTVLPIGSAMPWCSGPMAPGWNVSLPGGGCGGTSVFIPSGRSAVVRGVLHQCPAWFPSGCIVK